MDSCENRKMKHNATLRKKYEKDWSWMFIVHI